MANVSIIGSGNVGANTAFFIAEKAVTDVALYDIAEGVSTGKALDIMEVAPIRNYRTTLLGTDSLGAIEGSQVIVLTAGMVRHPGMKREDLVSANASIVTQLAPEIARLAPQSKVIVVTEPVDHMTRLFVEHSGMPRFQVMGLGGFLDTTRLRYLIARELSVSMENVTALVIGRHSDQMVGLPQYCSVSGIPLAQLMDSDQIENLLEQTRQAGDLIVELAQRSSAYYAPSAAAAELVDAIHRDLRRIFSISVLLDGEYGMREIALNLPAVVGKDGIAQLLTPTLSDGQLERLRASSEPLDPEGAGRQA